jgi:four helix bundle protein
MEESVLRSKSFAFAIRIVKVTQFLQVSKKEFVLAKQLLRCGTSVGAMVREAAHAESKADFIHKMAVAQKEVNESLY